MSVIGILVVLFGLLAFFAALGNYDNRVPVWPTLFLLALAIILLGLQQTVPALR